MENNMRESTGLTADLSILKKVVIFTEKHGYKINELSLEYNNDPVKMAFSINMCLNLMVYIETSEATGKEITSSMLKGDLPNMSDGFISEVLSLYREHGRSAIKIIIDRLLENNKIDITDELGNVIKMLTEEVFPIESKEQSMGKEAADIIKMCLKYNLNTELDDLFYELNNVDSKRTFILTVETEHALRTVGNANFGTLIKMFSTQIVKVLSQVEDDEQRSGMINELIASLYAKAVHLGNCKSDVEGLSKGITHMLTELDKALNAESNTNN